MTRAIAVRSTGALRALSGPLADPATWRATLYHLLDFPVAWIGLTLVVGGLVASVSLLPVVLLGLVVLALLLRLVRGVASVERARARVLLDLKVADPPGAQRATGIVRRVRAAIADPVAWRAMAYLLLRFPLGIAAAILTFATWFVAASFVTSPLWGPPAGGALWYAEGTQVVDTWPEYLVTVLIGLIVLVLAPWVVRAFAVLSRRLVRGLLGPGPGVRIQQLEGQRSVAVRAVDVDRRRIEQDLHDGAQVRLTALAMNLGLAREAIAEGSDPARVEQLVAEAHDQAKLALREIRDLARGIHPAILTDRGLDAALTSMVGRLPLPVDLHVDVPERPSPATESIVYFVAAEAVTNAIRHAGSSTIAVRVVGFGDEVIVEISDRGRGGADPRRGTGLASLRERVESTGGSMTVQSPEGVGTLVRAVVPCGS